MTKRKSPQVTKSAKEFINIPVSVVPEHTKGDFYQEPFWKQYWKQSLLVLALCFGLYYACLPFNYVLDDQMVITGNEYTKKGFDGIWQILTTESFEGYFGEKKELVQGNRYRPLSIITFAIEIGILGEMNPWVSHFINVLLYALTGILFMMVLTLLFRNVKSPNWYLSIPFIAAIFFILHPIHTEAVANIKGRDEIMSMLLSLSALYCGLRYMDRKSLGFLAASCISYFLGLLSKENAITFLAVIPLTIYFFSETNWKKLGQLFFWLVITTVLYLLLRFNTAGVPKLGQQTNDLMNNPFLGMKGGEKFGSIMYTLGKYIMLMIFPHPLSHDYYPYAIPKVTIVNIFSFLSLVFYVFLSYVGIKGLKSKSIIGYSILFYLVTLTIVSNIVINLGTFMNERFIFMASAGYCLALAYFISEQLPSLIKSNGRMLSIGLVAVISIGYSVKTFLRVPAWKDAISLNQAAVDVSSNSARANSFMSTALFEEFKQTKDRRKQDSLLVKADFYGQKAVAIFPEYQNANLMLIGVASEKYKLTGDINQYIKDMKPSILRRPDIPFIKEFGNYLKGRGHDSELFPFYLSIGTELLTYRDTRRDYALQFLLDAYEINPTNKPLNVALGTAYELIGNVNEANRFKMAAQNMQ